ncbi:RNA-directed DNA polymerase from transposon X [Brachionus plicatilis]|uniref:RNA-directed DNA polymerase from transposon X n=1 Tax=Brachionus plicatilis TaxID=10195 RepID=A0A3M7T827_BRAPC|nr:RNA-directed DNA polymerase from transposon X [Brachionus plicatilis]
MNLGKNSELLVFSLYNPPNVLLNFEFFKTCRNYILGGDLNARTKQIGCVGENENGIMLETIINDQDMTSDHFPIEASISMGYQLENKSAAKRFNYKKANWQLFSEILNSQIVNITECSLTIDQLNDKITEKIISASHKSIPYLSKKIYKTSLPPNIVNLIKERRKVRRNFQKTRCQKLKQKFNQLTSELKASLKKFWNQNWFDFIEKMGKNPLTRPNLIPNLILNENEFKTNEEKGKCFGELLSSIFSPNSDLIDSEKDIEILNSNSDFFRNYNHSNFNDPICLNELIMALKRLKNEAASGPDQIHNLISPGLY